MKTDTTQASCILIFEQPAGHYTVQLGEAVSQELVWDEMLAEVARLTMAGQPDRGRYMQSPEQLVAHMERRSQRAAQRVPPVTGRMLAHLSLQRAIDQRRGDR